MQTELRHKYCFWCHKSCLTSQRSRSSSPLCTAPPTHPAIYPPRNPRAAPGMRSSSISAGRGVTGDIDVGMLRSDAVALRILLAGWDIRIAAAGRLAPWAGGDLDSEASLHQNTPRGRSRPRLSAGEPRDREHARVRSCSFAVHRSRLRRVRAIRQLRCESGEHVHDHQPRSSDSADVGRRGEAGISPGAAPPRCRRR